MTYVNPFGGQPASPAYVGYRAFALAANVVLYWPWNNNDSSEVVARLMDVTPSSGSLTITLPSALEAGKGESVIVRNLGGSSFNILDNSGGVVAVVPPSSVYFIYLTDNTTAAGTWRAIMFGAAGSSVDAAALAGAGLTVVGSLLALNLQVTEVSNDYTVDETSDRATHFATTTSSGAFTLTLPAASIAGDGFFFMLSNVGTGTVTIDPDGSETIDGTSTLSIAPGESLIVNCSGSAWYSVGRGRSVVFVQTRLVKSVAGSSDVTLTVTEAGNIIQSYTGVLTGSINVIVPTSVAIYFVYNNTTGAFTLTVKTAAGTGVQVTQTKKTIVYCDGTNVVDADDETITTSFSMADGSAPSPGLAFQADPDTGFYRPGANRLGFSADGVAQAEANTDGFKVVGNKLDVQGQDVRQLALVYG